MVRFLEGGKKIVGKGIEFFDADILTNISGEQQKLSRILSNTLNKMKVKTGDVFIVGRIKAFADAGKLEVVGDWQKIGKTSPLKWQELQQQVL